MIKAVRAKVRIIIVPAGLRLIFIDGLGQVGLKGSIQVEKVLIDQLEDEYCKNSLAQGGPIDIAAVSKVYLFS